MRPLPVIAAIALLAAAPAFADEVPALEPDRLVLRLSAEGWVETATARLRVVVDAASTGERGGAGDLRGRVLASLERLVAGSEWRLTHVGRSRDKAGLDRWRVNAETRRPEDKLAGVYGRARAASRPGLQVRIAGIDFTPTLAEREAVLAALRREIYGRVKAELARVQGVHPDRKFRIRLVDFLGRPGPKAGRRLAMMETDGAPRQPGGMSVSQRLRLDATVILAAD